MGEIRDAYRVLIGNLRESDHSEDTGVDESIILIWMLRRRDEGGQRLDWSG